MLSAPEPLPAPLVATHIHTQFPSNTTCSGEDTIANAIAQAKHHGFRGIVLANHSSDPQVHETRPSMRQLGGWLREQEAEILKSIKSSSRDFMAMTGLECNLLPDGGIDITPSVAKQTGYVLASQHGGLGDQEKDAKAIMHRFTTAARNPHIHAIAHPGRRIDRENGVDWEELLDLWQHTGTLAEFNVNSYWKGEGNPEWWRKYFKFCADTGVGVVIGYDVHNEHMWPSDNLTESWHTPNWNADKMLELAALMGVRPGQVINRTVDSWLEWLTTPKRERRHLVVA